ncbi:uncharacterized protein C2orf15 homolog isoform X1 [Trachypithecus francoisi]|uniref:uncharacterized protein C2orf15 homolog isoform X1 n=2 Tax=Trachypithecus francoisi TaxID=54180 RepID=UPI00141B339F|nr:uncharacterized protein C2orf15 homolog isoform X1 [Trachypithecus francoisi]
MERARARLQMTLVGFYSNSLIRQNAVYIKSKLSFEEINNSCFCQVSAMHMDSKVDDHLIRGTEKSRLEPTTQLFQNTKKIRLEDTNQENFSRIEGTGTRSLSEKALGSVVYVKESDGLEMTDVE